MMPAIICGSSSCCAFCASPTWPMVGTTEEFSDTASGLEGSIFSEIFSSRFLSIESTAPRSLELAPRTHCRVCRANGFAIETVCGRRENVHSCERYCWRSGAEVARNAGVEEVFRERRMLREAPERSMLANRPQWLLSRQLPPAGKVRGELGSGAERVACQWVCALERLGAV